MNSTTPFFDSPATRSASARAALPAALGAMMLGAALLYLAGFAEAEALHHGAHDARHVAALPCH